MPKNKTMPELYLAYHIGLTPKDLIAKGLQKVTVYNYHRRYKQNVKPAFEELVKTIK